MGLYVVIALCASRIIVLMTAGICKFCLQLGTLWMRTRDWLPILMSWRQNQTGSEFRNPQMGNCGGYLIMLRTSSCLLAFQVLNIKRFLVFFTKKLKINLKGACYGIIINSWSDKYLSKQLVKYFYLFVKISLLVCVDVLGLNYYWYVVQDQFQLITWSTSCCSFLQMLLAGSVMHWSLQVF